MRGGSNRRRIIVTVGLVLCITVLTIYMAYRVYYRAEQQCWERLSDASSNTNRQFSQRMEAEINSIRGVARSISLVENVQSEETMALLRRSTNSSGLTQSPMRVLLPNGYIITEKGEPYRYDDGSTFKELYTDKAGFYGVRGDLLDKNKETFCCVAPVVSGDKVKALLVKCIEKEQMATLIQNDEFNGVVNILVVDREDGSVIIDTGHLYRYKTITDFFDANKIVDGKPEEIIQSVLDGGSGRLVILEEEHEERQFMHYMQSTNFNWMVMVYVPESLAFADSTHLMSLFTVFGALEAIILVAYFIWILRDTLAQIDKVVLEERLVKAEKAEKAKTTFLFNMSHDIRTPMNAIMGYTDIAKRHIEDTERVKDCLDKIDISGVHLLQIINDVLDMARIETGNVVIEEKPLDITESVNETVIMCKSVAETKGVDISLDIGEVRDRHVLGDQVHLNEVLVNVASNAIKYTEEGGRVVVRLNQDEPYIDGIGDYTIEIEDTGIGMSEEFLAHIFDTFTRERSTTISGIEGTGLGMSIVKKLVEQLGGTIDITSRKGVGTKVTLHFTMKTFAETADMNEESGEARSLKGCRILLVEDNEMNREIARVILEEAGAYIEDAEDGDIAVDKIRNSNPGDYDLILMDIQMPRMDGYSATRAIRELSDTDLASIPIVAMTANAFGEDKAKAMEAGMNAHVPKPIEFTKLFDTIQSVTKSKGERK